MSVASDRIRLWREKPQAFVRDVFGVTPDAWQDDALEAFPHSPRLCMRACAGPGKSAVLAWLGWNFLLTRPHPMVGVTSITGDNLKANLWTEFARWREKSDLLKTAFDMTAEAIFSKENPRTWRLEGRKWAKDADQNAIGNALRGLHAKYVLWLLDESGDYPNAILPVCENIFSGDPAEAHIVQAGNPTQLDGPLYRACTVARHLWKVIEITGDPDDPKRSPRISIEHAREQIRQYGRDNPWVMVNILGQFPPSSLNTLLGPDVVRAAMTRHVREDQYAGASKVLGVDVAREGDDASVIFPRQGIAAFQPIVLRNASSIQGAGQVARKWRDWGADGCFIDNTGGFGGGWLDQLAALKFDALPVHFAGAATDVRYANKRAEMWFALAEWIKQGGALPDIPEMVAELTTPTYSFKGDKLILEDKKQVKARLGRSPDYADALALTFAHPVMPSLGTGAGLKSSYDVLGGFQSSYDTMEG